MGSKTPYATVEEDSSETFIKELLPVCLGDVICLTCLEEWTGVWQIGQKPIICPYCGNDDTVREIRGDTRGDIRIPCSRYKE